MTKSCAPETPSSLCATWSVSRTSRTRRRMESIMRWVSVTTGHYQRLGGRILHGPLHPENFSSSIQRQRHLGRMGAGGTRRRDRRPDLRRRDEQRGVGQVRSDRVPEDPRGVLRYGRVSTAQVTNAKCRMQNAECRMQNAECRMMNERIRLNFYFSQFCILHSAFCI